MLPIGREIVLLETGKLAVEKVTKTSTHQEEATISVRIYRKLSDQIHLTFNRNSRNFLEWAWLPGKAWVTLGLGTHHSNAWRILAYFAATQRTNDNASSSKLELQKLCYDRTENDVWRRSYWRVGRGGLRSLQICARQAKGSKDQGGSGRDGMVARNFHDLESLQAWLCYSDLLHVVWNWLHLNGLFLFLRTQLAASIQQTGLSVEQLSCLMVIKIRFKVDCFLNPVRSQILRMPHQKR